MTALTFPSGLLLGCCCSRDLGGSEATQDIGEGSLHHRQLILLLLHSQLQSRQAVIDVGDTGARHAVVCTYTGPHITLLSLLEGKREQQYKKNKRLKPKRRSHRRKSRAAATILVIEYPM